MPNFKHGLKKTQEYNSWNHMRSRCNNPKLNEYKDYGGRGIKVCPEWNHFVNFLADMGLMPQDGKDYSIERIENDKGYYKENCKWTTAHYQTRNKRNNVKVMFQGIEYLLCDLALKVGICQKKLRMRLFVYGWPIEKAILNIDFKSKLSAIPSACVHQ